MTSAYTCVVINGLTMIMVEEFLLFPPRQLNTLGSAQ